MSKAAPPLAGNGMSVQNLVMPHTKSASCYTTMCDAPTDSVPPSTRAPQQGRICQAVSAATRSQPQDPPPSAPSSSLPAVELLSTPLPA